MQSQSVKCFWIVARLTVRGILVRRNSYRYQNEVIQNHHHKLTIFLAGVISVGVPTLSEAQAAASASVMPPAGDELQEIVVTAERREERLQSVPMAVSVITAEAALKSRITTSEDLPLAVPGLQMDLTGVGMTPFLRGVGTTFVAPGAEPSVAIYVDGGYMPSSAGGLFNLNNIERVEVLKGPQGTLFGRNATGGVIQVISREPSSESSADLSVGYGNYDTSMLNFYVTTGLAAGLATDLAVYADDHPDGWGHNFFTGDRNYKYENIDVRNTWLWQPQESTRIKLALDYEDTTNEAGLGFKPLPGTMTIAGTTYAGFYNTDSNVQDRTVMHQGGVLLQGTQDLQFAALKSISTYREVRPNFFLDQDASPLPIVNAQVFDPDNSITQELQLISPEASKVQWIGGLFYFHDVAGLAPTSVGGLAAAPFSLISIAARQHTDSYAGYAQTTLEVAPESHFTAGIRYTEDRRSIGGTTSAEGVGAIAPTVHQSADFDKVTWRLALDHQFTPDVLSYVSYNRGFKSGLFNTDSYAQPAVKPEVLDAYEIGLKSEYFEHRFRANLAGYYYHYTDLQVTEDVTGSQIVLNAAKAEIYGLDADFAVVPIHNLTLNASLAFIHGRYTSFPNAPYFPSVTASNCSPAIGATGACTINATGLNTVHTPSFTMNMSADYAKPTQVGRFDLAADFYHNDGFYWDPANQVRQPTYSLYNASIGWMNRSDRYGMRLWGKNLGGAKYYSFAISQTLGEDFSSAPPRTYGVTISAHF
jgi:iron complex outermembrane recepter protein